MSSLLWTADQLARHHFAHSFLVEPIILRGGINLLHGKRGIGKSHFAMTLAACISEQGALFGKYPTHPLGPVVYVQADVPPWLTQGRLRRAQTIYPFKNVLFYFPTSFNLAAMNHQTPLVQEVQSHNPSLVIWDTLRKIHRGNSNDDDVPSMIYGLARDLFPKAAHLFIHHDKKTIVDQDQLDKEEEFRGSGAWIDDAHTGMHLVEVARNTLMLYFTKTNACEEQPSVGLTLSLETLLLYSAPDTASRLAAWYRGKYPSGSPTELERYLLASFVGGPRIARALAQGQPNDAAPAIISG